MSSHHIVRDNQEPALLIVSDNFKTETLHNLLEWSPVVFVVGEYYERLQAHGFKIDHVVGSVQSFQNLDFQLNRIESGSKTALEAVIDYLKNKDHRILNILGLNDFEALDLTNNELQLIAYSKDLRCIYVRSRVKKWYGENRIVGWGGKIRQATYNGMSFENDCNEFVTKEAGFLELTGDNFKLYERL